MPAKYVSSRLSMESWSSGSRQHAAFLIGLTLCVMLLAPCIPADAQPSTKIPRVGYLRGGSAELEKVWLVAFLQGLRELGYLEGKSIVVERRYAAGRYEELPALAAELIRLKVDVILAASTPVAHSAKKTTNSIPIVMVVADPVGTGLVASLARPGANITGLSDFHADLVTKRLELLKEVAVSLSRVAVLSNPASPTCPTQFKDLNAAGPALGLTLVVVEARNPEELPNSFSRIKRSGSGRSSSVATECSTLTENKFSIL